MELPCFFGKNFFINISLLITFGYSWYIESGNTSNPIVFIYVIYLYLSIILYHITYILYKITVTYSYIIYFSLSSLI
jgi:hypothetical protein